MTPPKMRKRRSDGTCFWVVIAWSLVGGGIVAFFAGKLIELAAYWRIAFG